MKKTGTLLLALLLLVTTCFALVGCQNTPTVQVYNWEDYIDPEVLKDFEEETGITVKYSRFTTNEDMYALMEKGGVSYDVVFPSDYMIERMIQNDMLQTIDTSKLENYGKIGDQFKDLDYDPNNEYSVPYMWGTVGILYNKTMVNGTPDSWDVLWDEQYKDQILMIDSIRDSLGITLKKLGYSLNTQNKDEIEAAKIALQEQWPLALAYVVDEGKDKMIRGEAAMAVVWSGDAVYAMSENEDLDYFVPKEGSNFWFDAMVIPKNAKNPEYAQKFIDFMCRPDIAARNTEYIGYSTPVPEALDILEENEYPFMEAEAFNPSDDVINNCEIFHDLGDNLSYYEQIWTEIKNTPR